MYQGTYCIVIRDFKAAANFFLDTISTFTSYELMDYETFVRYTVYISMISLPRNELRDKVIQCFRQSNAAYVKIQNKYYCILGTVLRPPLWSSGQSFWLQIQRSRVRFPALPDFLSSSGSGTGSTQPREVN